MKIAITSLVRFGAGPMYSFEMAKALSQKAEVLCIVSSYAENIHLWRDEANSNPAFKIYEVTTYNHLASFVIKTLSWWRYRTIAKVINDFAPDIIYSPFFHFWDKFIFKRVSCRRIVKTYHDIQMHAGENHPFRELLFRPFFYKTEKCIILSEVFKPTMVTQYGYKEQDVVVIPHASFNQYCRNYTLDLDTKYHLLCFGRIVQYKGLGVMLEAMKLVIQQRPEIKLLIVGDGNFAPYKEKLSLVAENVETHIRWIKDTEVEHFFSQVDMAVLPYTEASQSGVIPLANSFGKPTIASNLGGLPEQIIENQTGIIVPPNDAKVLANVILDTYNDEAKLKEMKKAAYDYAGKNSWERSAEIFLRAFS